MKDGDLEEGRFGRACSCGWLGSNNCPIELCPRDQVQGASAVLPDGDELPDEELVSVEGEVDLLTIAAAAVAGAGLGAAGDLFVQGVEIAAGQRESIDWVQVGKAAGIGAVTGAVGEATGLTKIVRSAMVTGARWAVRAAQATSAAAVSFGTRAYGFLCEVHATLHHYVTEPVVNFFKRLVGK